MRLAKCIVIGLICLGVSLQGLASVAVVKAPCPMTQADDVSSAAPAAQDELGHDCCTDAETFAKTGKVCKSDLTCQPVTQVPQSAHVLVVRIMTAASPDPFPDRAILPLDPVPVWRPPALI
jgi:hypothetical protein